MVDTLPPPLTVIPPPSVVGDGQVLVRVATEAGTRMSLLVASSSERSQESGRADLEGRFLWLAPVFPGDNVIVVQAEDEVGNRSSTQLRIFRDMDPPEVACVSHRDGQIVNESSPTLRLRLKDNRSVRSAQVFVERRGSRPVKPGAEVLVPIKDLPEGATQIWFSATDEAGWTTTRPIQLIVDSTETFGTRPLVEGALGDDVRELQRRLVRLGRLESYLVVGRFGPGTVQAVQALQKARALPVTGAVEAETMALLQTRIYVNVGRSSMVVEQPGKPLLRFSVAVGTEEYPPRGAIAL